MEELKANMGKYIYGAIGGAIVVLVLGFWVGPLTTNGSADELASAAASDRDVVYCVANAQRLVASGAISAPSSSSEKTDLARASLADLLPDEKASGSVVRLCTRALP